MSRVKSRSRRTANHSRTRPVASGGFTLMETMAAILITTLVVTFAMSAYIQVAETAEGATLRLRDELHATTILDRLAADLESAVLLVKPEETDPLRHPWYFVSESRAAFDGSDAVRFIGRRTRTYHGDEHISDFGQIAYQIETDESGLQTLHRWLAPGLPDEYGPSFPLLEEERNHVLGEGLSGFSLRFLDGEGEWVESWDSTQLTQSSLLPVSVEISFDMGVREEGFATGEVARYRRQIVLPMQAIDLDGMITAAREALGEETTEGNEGDADGEGATDQLACIQAACESQANLGDLCANAAALWNQLDPTERDQYAAQAGCN